MAKSKNRRKTQDARRNPSAPLRVTPKATKKEKTEKQVPANQTLKEETKPRPISALKKAIDAFAATPSHGVLLLALGHPNYGQMAANLAASIRFGDKSTPIHLVWSGDALSHLTPDKLALFSSTKEVPNEFITTGDKTTFFKAKTHIYDLSPFDVTLYLDVDMLWNGGKKPMHQAFEFLKGVEFTIQNRDTIDLSRTAINADEWLWGDANDVKKAYNLKEGRLYGLHAELIYFTKSAANKAYFEKVREVYSNPIAPPKPFAGGIADEYAFAIASVLTGHYPHQTPFMMVYWYKMDGRTTASLSGITESYWAYSAGGNVYPPKMIEQYNILAQAYAKGVGVQYPWKLRAKRAFIPERKLM